MVLKAESDQAGRHAPLINLVTAIFFQIALYVAKKWNIKQGGDHEQDCRSNPNHDSKNHGDENAGT